MAAFWIMTNSVVHSSSTETRPLIKTDYLQLRNFMGAPPRIPFLLTAVHFLKSGNVRQKKMNSKLRQHRSPLKLTTMHMLTPLQKLELAPMLPSNILEPSCGTFMGLSQPYHPIEGTTSKPPVVVC